jgi:hypothetical protein
MERLEMRGQRADEGKKIAMVLLVLAAFKILGQFNVFREW